MPDYADLIASLSMRAVEAGGPSIEFFDSLWGEKDAELVSAISAEDHPGAASVEPGHLAVGLFEPADEDQRTLAFQVAMDVQRHYEVHGLRERLSSYSTDQPIFELLPKLWPPARDDLLASTMLGGINRFGQYRIDGITLGLDPFVPPEVIEWIQERNPRDDLLVRIDPRGAVRAGPRPLREAVIRPANPTWWSGLNLPARERDGGRYEIQPPTDPRDNLQDWWDFAVGKFRRLETSAIRRESDYLTGMTEELQLADGYLIGRCVHWDTSAEKGIPVYEAPLGHCDLAVNIYVGETMNARLSQDLSKGKVDDATFRSHLIRFESESVSAVLDVAARFFRSRSLLSDWMRDQFS